MRLKTARTPASMQGPSQVEGESASDWPPVLAARSMPMSQAKVHPAGWLARSPRPSLHPVQLGCAETQHSPAPQTISSPLQRRAQSLRAAPEQAGSAAPQQAARRAGGHGGVDYAGGGAGPGAAGAPDWLHAPDHQAGAPRLLQGQGRGAHGAAHQPRSARTQEEQCCDVAAGSGAGRAG